jgi:cardiolipin synthase A/B
MMLGRERKGVAVQARSISPMTTPGWTITLLYVADIGIRVGLSIRVILSRRPVGVSLAWLFVILLMPFVGAMIYLIIGELRIGRRREANWERLRIPHEQWLASLHEAFDVDWSAQRTQVASLSRLAARAGGIPALPGNRLSLIGDWQRALESIIGDIDAAQHSCHLEFYIWHPGGVADDVAGALLRAAGRGVSCRVLLDAVGSARFLESRLARQLRDGGVELVSALPGGLFHFVVKRFDLRMHRKLVVIDGAVAYTGSLNLIDPRYFKRDSNVGQWVDAMVRVEGPAVEPMAITFLGDWAVERGHSVEEIRALQAVTRRPRTGDAIVQVVPTGPTLGGDAEQILLTTIYAAQRELTVTTPYFVPDEMMVSALLAAAHRGVDVTVVLPERVDSVLVRFASQPHLGVLLVAGVRIMLFRGGLLHTKSVVVDDDLALFGSLNLDPRSLHLNFEITLGVVDAPFHAQLKALQRTYIAQSRPMSFVDWHGRSGYRRLLDNAARLVSPLL